jgi:hypothetical protein
VVVFLDGDYSDRPAELPRILEPVGGGRADIVVGSRLANGRPRGALPWHSVLGNRLAARLVGLVWADLLSHPAQAKGDEADHQEREAEGEERGESCPIERKIRARPVQGAHRASSGLHSEGAERAKRMYAELERAITRFVAHYNYRPAPRGAAERDAGGCLRGRQGTILDRRARIKREMLVRRKRANLTAA